MGREKRRHIILGGYMRLTKEFIRQVHHIAVMQGHKAEATGRKMITKFLQQDDQLTILFNYLFPPELYLVATTVKQQHETIRKTLTDLTTNKTITNNMGNYLLGKHNANEDNHPLFEYPQNSERPLSFEVTFIDKQEHKTKLDIKDLITDTKTPTLKLAALTSSGYQYGRSLEVPIKVAEVFAADIYDEYEQLVQTGAKLQKLCHSIRQQGIEMENYTTLKQLQANTLIWHLIKDHEYVETWISQKEQAIQNKKNAAEAKRKRDRIAAAEARKQELDELKHRKELGLPEIPKPKDTSKEDTTLIKALNRFSDSNKGNNGG